MTLRKAGLYLFFSALAATGSADFVNDEFDGAALGTQWTFTQGVNTHATAIGEVMPNTPPGHLSLYPGIGTRFGWDEHTDTNISQDQPADDTWEVHLKVDNWNPSPSGPTWQQVGLRLYQDNSHWLGINVTVRPTGPVLQAQSEFSGDVTRTNLHITELPLFNFVKPDPLYLRIQKTSKGYTTGYSADGIDWIDRGTFVRNPYSADGFLDPSAQIRVSTIAPENNGDGQVEAVELDWIRKVALAPTTSGYANDEFTGTELGSNWLYYDGIYNIPGIPGTVSVADGFAKLQHSTGFDLGFAHNQEKPQFIMQDAPTTENFSLVTRVIPANLTTAGNWEGHGLRVWQDQNHWIAIVNQRNGAAAEADARNQVELRYELGHGAVTVASNTNIGTSNTDPGPELLRIDKEGTKYRALYKLTEAAETWTIATDTSIDPEGWVDFGEELRNAQVQLFTKRPQAGRTAATSEFDYIREISESSVEDWQLF